MIYVFGTILSVITAIFMLNYSLDKSRSEFVRIFCFCTFYDCALMVIVFFNKFKELNIGG